MMQVTLFLVECLFCHTCYVEPNAKNAECNEVEPVYCSPNEVTNLFQLKFYQLPFLSTTNEVLNWSTVSSFHSLWSHITVLPSWKEYLCYFDFYVSISIYNTFTGVRYQDGPCGYMERMRRQYERLCTRKRRWN